MVEMVTTTDPRISGSETGLPDELDDILRRTSRSVYLTLKVSPASLRRQLMLSYLFCRAADTIADTRVLPPAQRVEMLEIYRSQFVASEPDVSALAPICELSRRTSGAGFSEGEKALLAGLKDCFLIYDSFDSDDRDLIRTLLRTLTLGMATDLQTFPSEEEAQAEQRVVALETAADLDRYCYHVAGCVGEFWTHLHGRHLPEFGKLDRDVMTQLGIRFGKSLQMTNVLRDTPADLLIGRCYLPLEYLDPAGVAPEELLAAATGSLEGAALKDLLVRIAPVMHQLLDETLAHSEAGWDYTLRLPRRLLRSRLACAWPLLIGLETLALLRHRMVEWLRGGRLKTTRSRIYGIVAESSLCVWSNRALDRVYRRLERPCLYTSESAQAIKDVLPHAPKEDH